MTSHAFQRTSQTWLAYVTLGFFSFMFSFIGPLIPVLKSTLNMSYAQAALHTSAFALGMVIVGLGGQGLVLRWGRTVALKWALLGMAVGLTGVALAPLWPLTVVAAGGMGFFAALILVVVPPLLADLHSHWRGQAFAEANVAACVGGLLAPLCVSSLLVHLDWRGVAAVGWLGALLLWWPLKRIALPAPLAHPHDHVHHLPWRFWGFWTLLVLSVSAEFSFNVWGASFFEGVVGMPKAQAVFAFTAFPVGMLLGRFSGALFYRQLGEARLILASLLLALLGFVLFWGQAHPLGCALGLFLAGLGVANQYPMMFSSAVATAPQSSELAAARVSMGSGLAIIVAPLVLGMLADGIGMRLGYLIVPLMLLTALLLWWRLQAPALKAQSC